MAMTGDDTDPGVQGDLAAAPPTVGEADGTPAADRALVSKWIGRIQKGQQHHAKAFKRMRDCMYMATHGGTKTWVEADNYVAPLIVRFINLAVAQLYAKDPTIVVKRRKRRMYTVWDGKEETLQAAQVAAQGEAQVGMPGPATAQLDALMQDIAAVKEYNRMVDGIAETMQILWEYQLNEQVNAFKTQIKALVRRAKTCGVGYVKLGFQRQFEPVPEKDDALPDQTPIVANVKRMEEEETEGEAGPESADAAELQYTDAAMQEKGPLVREGIYLSYPKATRVIVDPGCTDLKTLHGADWLAHEIPLTPEEIEEAYGVDVGSALKQVADAVGGQSDKSKEEGALRVYEVQDKRTGMYMTICEGYPGFLRAPAAPPIFVEQFFNIFPLVFNEIESEDELFPPSDVWRARHMQNEYNRSREGVRQHRIAARPYYVVGRSLEDEGIRKLGNHADHEIIYLPGLGDGQKVDDLIQRGPTAPLDPNLYEVEGLNTDILRSVGVQEANLGGLSGGTATESSIAESSRMSSISDNADDLDDLLERLARAGGQVLLVEMSKQMVAEIVGDGAVWPDAPETRQEVAQELLLSFEAGSSGRPNKAQEIANLERAAPTLLQMPGWNPQPMARKYAQLLDIDPEEAYTAGLPSVVAQNGMMTKPMPGPEAPPSPPQGDVPAAQGPAGGGGPAPAQPTGPQPAYPTRSAGLENVG